MKIDSHHYRFNIPSAEKVQLLRYWINHNENTSTCHVVSAEPFDPSDPNEKRFQLLVQSKREKDLIYIEGMVFVLWQIENENDMVSQNPNAKRLVCT